MAHFSPAIPTRNADIQNGKKKMAEIKAVEGCVFCQIVEGKTPSKKVFEDEKTLAILDIIPASFGHILFMPKKHYAILPMMEQADFLHFTAILRKLVAAQKKALLLESVTVFVANGQAAGQQSSHFMIHLVPRERNDSLGFFHPKRHSIDAKNLERDKAKIISLLTQKP